jgi:hypothetical protein
MLGASELLAVHAVDGRLRALHAVAACAASVRLNLVAALAVIALNDAELGSDGVAERAPIAREPVGDGLPIVFTHWVSRVLRAVLGFLGTPEGPSASLSFTASSEPGQSGK